MVLAVAGLAAGIAVTPLVSGLLIHVAASALAPFLTAAGPRESIARSRRGSSEVHLECLDRVTAITNKSY
jgi:hypothetical protein